MYTTIEGKVLDSELEPYIDVDGYHKYCYVCVDGGVGLYKCTSCEKVVHKRCFQYECDRLKITHMSGDDLKRDDWECWYCEPKKERRTRKRDI